MARQSERDIDGAALRSCAELLTYLDRSSRIRTNELVGKILGDRGSDSVDAAFIEHLQSTVHEVLENLSPRQREIIERCDFRGERSAAVCASLSISRAQFFRERHAAHRRIAERLLRPDPPPAEIVPYADGFEAQLRFSQILENNGRWQDGAVLLQRLAAEVGTPEKRCVVELRLSQLYAEFDRFSLARHHASIARDLAGSLHSSEQWRALEVEVAFGRISLNNGDFSRAAETLGRNSTLLRSWAAESTSSQLEATIVDALIMRTLAQDGRGDFATAALSIADACSIADRSPLLNPQLKLSARAFAALRDGDASKAEATLWRCYNDALVHGLTRTALMIAALLAVNLRLRSEFAKAISFLAPLLDAARFAGEGTVIGSMLLELVYANVGLGDFETAASYSDELAHSVATDPTGQGMANVAAARVHFGLGNFAQSLVCAENAEAIFTRIGFSRPIGSVLVYQGEALASLGRIDEARHVLSAALEMIPYTIAPSRLASAFDLMANLSGQTKFATQARKLRALGER